MYDLTTGNKEKAIEFNTHSGILKAIQEKDSSITLDFPLNPPSPYQAQNLKDIIRVVVENLEIQDVQHSSTTKKLLLRLADKYKRRSNAKKQTIYLIKRIVSRDKFCVFIV